MRFALLNLLQLLNWWDPVCADVSLTAEPDRTQFFKYDFFTLSCEEEEEALLTGWEVKMRTTKGEVKPCLSKKETAAWQCPITLAYPNSDSGLYWCENELGERSNTLKFTVTDGPVILESPSRPATEGDNVILRCTTQEDLTSDPSADFYKDGALVGTEPTREMTLHGVSAGDEGLYGCRVSGLGESPQSWVRVEAPPLSPGHNILSVPRLVSHVIVGIPFLVTTVLLALIYYGGRATARRANQKRSISHRVVMDMAP